MALMDDIRRRGGVREKHLKEKEVKRQQQEEQREELERQRQEERKKKPSFLMTLFMSKGYMAGLGPSKAILMPIHDSKA
jgi:demethoxyubiquinone hydroxylase (CLK1/Coq7/Cat5 family)